MAQLRRSEAAARYAAAAHPVFNDARDAALKLAAILIVATVGRSRHLIDLPARGAALDALARAKQGFQHLAPPPAAEHFHFHVANALEKLEVAFASADAERAGKAGHDPLAPLRSAWADIEAATRALPGFETIDFTQSCCALHRTRLANTHGGFDGTLLDMDS